jgi:hypothetical protein
VMMRSESTSALGQPSDVNDMRGALFKVSLKACILNFAEISF